MLYVPAALQLTHGGTFGRHADSGWDNPECAKLILHNLLASHRTQLDTLKSSNGSRSLAEIAVAGLEATDPSQVVDAAIELKEELARTNVPGVGISGHFEPANAHAFSDSVATIVRLPKS